MSGAQDWINTIVSGLSLVATAVIARVAYNKTREANETAKRSLGEAKRAADAAAETASIERARYVESRTARLRVDDVRVVNEHPVGASPWSDALVIDVENIGRATAYAVRGVLSCAGQSIPGERQAEVSPGGRRQLRFSTRPIPFEPGGISESVEIGIHVHYRDDNAAHELVIGGRWRARDGMDVMADSIPEPQIVRVTLDGQPDLCSPLGADRVSG